MGDITEFRNSALRARRKLTDEERDTFSRQIVATLLRNHDFETAQSIGLFLPMRDEVQIEEAIQCAWAAGQRVFVPRVVSRDMPLEFREYRPDTRMKHGRLGIREPDPQFSSSVSPSDLDLVVVPLVAFDSKRHRIGMGAGHYDRTFAFRLLNRETKQPRLIGVAFSVQQVPIIEPNPWDVPLDLVITEIASF